MKALRSRGARAALLLLPPVFAVLALAFALLGPPSEARAGSITIGQTNARSEDPTSIRFSTRVNSTANVTSAEFVFSVANPDGNVGGSGSVNVSPGGELDLIFELQTRNAERYIPIGSEILYHWKVTDADGVERVSEQGSFIFLDGRYDWKQISEGDVTVYYYSSLDAAERALAATRSSIANIEVLLQTEVSYPVKVVVWRVESEGELAQRPRGSAFDSTVITGGARVAPDLLHVYDALSSFTDVVRHEAAHIVTHVAGDGPFAQVPSWLDEGVAVYAQSDPGQGYRSGVSFAIQTDTLFRLRSLNSPANDAARVNAFYGQSWSTVDYLISTYGEERFADLFATIFAGSDIERALESVYGFNSDGLYNEWRRANGLAALEFAAIDSGGFAPSEATVAPLGIPTSVGSAPNNGSGSSSGSGGAAATPGGGEQPAPAGASGGGGSSSGPIVLVIALVVAGLLGGGAFALLRRRPDAT